MRRQIKERNILYYDLTDQENELSPTITPSIPFIEKPEEELKEEIANNLVRNRFLQFQDRVNYRETENNIILQNEKTKEFEKNLKNDVHLIMMLAQLHIFFHICF
jgi:DNA-directed RNA polymerase specialized sigma54-like protein